MTRDLPDLMLHIDLARAQAAVLSAPQVEQGGLQLNQMHGGDLAQNGRALTLQAVCVAVVHLPCQLHMQSLHPVVSLDIPEVMLA